MAPRPQISSSGNPLVRRARALRSAKGRAGSGCFLVEGLHHAGSALEAGWEIETVFYAPDLAAGEYAARLLQEVARKGVPAQPVTRKVFESLAEKDNPQGVLAVVRQQRARLETAGDFTAAVALVAPQDPGNVGTILRTMEAAGAGPLVLLEGGVELFHPTVVRASMGALFRVPVAQADFQAFRDWTRVRGATLVGTSAHAALDFRRALPLSKPWALVMGNEQKGLATEMLADCDLAVSIPVAGRASSLNLAVAAGIFLYAFLLNE